MLGLPQGPLVNLQPLNLSKEYLHIDRYFLDPSLEMMKKLLPQQKLLFVSILDYSFNLAQIIEKRKNNLGCV